MIRGLTVFGAVVTGVGVANTSIAHVLVEILPIILAIVVAGKSQHRSVTTAALTLGLSYSATALVHLTDGLIEAHFAFFVALPLIALFHDWRAIVGAAAVVFLHHAIAGTLDPTRVYNHPAAQENPIVWGFIHVVFVLSLVVVLFAHWHYSEAELRVSQRAVEGLTRAQDEIVTAGERFRSLVQNAFDAIIVVDETGNISYIGGAFGEVFGLDPDDHLGLSVTTLRDRLHPDDVIDLQQALTRISHGADAQSIQTRFWHTDATWRWLELVVRASRTTEAGNGLVINVRDITASKRSQELLEHRAGHDELTGLPNRSLLVDRLSVALQQDTDEIVGLLFLDLDRFKNVNDTLGHGVGDQLLVAVARRLEGAIRDRDTVARLGGDEFVVLVSGVESVDALVAVGDRVRATLDQPIALDGIAARVAVSIGVSIARPGDDAIVLLRNADVAMYQAKQAGRGRVEVFDEAFRKRTTQRLLTETALRNADFDAEMIVHYQPIVDMSTGGVVAYEALVRWNHPIEGLLFPGAFIPVAEETGLIVDLGDWVLREACGQTLEWQQGVARLLDISVNVSAAQLSGGSFVRVVSDALANSGLDPGRLVIEVTETSLMRSPEIAQANLGAVRDMGVRVALDDFGTGYAGLSYLRTLPVTHIKIDRSFIDALGREADATVIVENTISLAHGLDMTVVAEGIETEQQYRLLRELGCDYGQGYHLGRPAPGNAVQHDVVESRVASSAGSW